METEGKFSDMPISFRIGFILAIAFVIAITLGFIWWTPMWYKICTFTCGVLASTGIMLDD